MYSLKHKVSYSEISTDQQINVAQAIRYFQDTSTFHSEEVGDTVDSLKNKQCAWLLSAWQLEIERYPTFGEEIIISTWPHENKNLFAQRNFQMKDAEGNSLMKANSIWFYFDFQTKAPRKILPEYVDCYGIEERLPMNYKGRKVMLPEGIAGEHKDSFLVRKSDLDTNGHVNNSKYVEMALEYVKNENKVIGMRADYRKSALLNDRIHPVVSRYNNYIYVELTNGEEPFVVIEFEIDLRG